MCLAPSRRVMRIVSIRTVTCAAALFVGVTVTPVVARQSGSRDARATATAQTVTAQTQRSPLGPGEEELEGTLEVLVEDHARGTVVHRFLDTGRGKVRLLEALGDSDLDGMMTGQRVRARGRRSQDGSTLQLASSGGGSTVTTVACSTRITRGAGSPGAAADRARRSPAPPYRRARGSAAGAPRGPRRRGCRSRAGRRAGAP